MKTKKYFVLAFVAVFLSMAFCYSAQAAGFGSVQDGNWNDSVTWNATTYSYPSSISVDSSGKMYVADTYNNRIVVLNADGTASAVYTGSDISTLSGSPTNDFNYPYSISVDSSGKMYVADSNNNRIVVLNADGTASAVYTGSDISTLSGNPTNGFYGPYGISVDSSGKMYVADYDNNRIVVLNANGTASAVYTGSDISTLSGSPTNNFSYPWGISVDSSGKMYVADTYNNRIVVLNADGTASAVYTGDDISTLSGNPTNNFSYPTGISVDSSGKMYVADSGNNRIVVLNEGGTASAVYTGSDISTLSGSPTNNFNYPTGISLDSSGKMYVADSNHNRIVVLNADGTASAVYTDTTLPNVEGQSYPDTSSNAVINNTITLISDQSVHNLTINSTGTLNLNGYTLTVSGNFTNYGAFTAGTGTVNLTGANQYISGNNTFYNLNKTTTTADTLHFFSGDTQTITGTLSLNGATDNPLALRGFTINGFASPKTAVTDADGNIYIADDRNARVVVLNPDGSIKVTYTGSDISSLPGSPNNYFNNNPGPFGVAIGPNGKIYVTDVGNSRIVVLNSDGTAYAVYDGSDISSLPGSPTANFGDLKQIAIDLAGNIYVTSGVWGNGSVVVLNPDGTAKAVYDGSDISSLPGSPTAGIGSATGVAVDSSGNIYVVGDGNNRVVVLNPDGTAKAVYDGSDISSLPGSPTAGFGHGPESVAVDSSGNIYVSDDSNGRVVVLNPDGTAKAVYDGSDISTLPGSPTNYFTSGPGPAGISLDSHGNIYVADVGNNRIVVLNPDGSAKAVYHGTDISSTPLPWNIDPEGTVSASYLNIVKSTNLASTPIDCTTGCTDGGGNTNWTFPQVTTAPVATPPSNGAPVGSYGGGGGGSGGLGSGVTPVLSRPQIDYPDGTIFYLDTHSTTTPSVLTSTTTATSATTGTTTTTTITSLQTLISTLTTQLNSLLSQAKAAGLSITLPSTTTYTFTRNLSLGSKGSDVTALQQYLISQGYLKLSVPPTSYFGHLTQSALEKFQSANHITPASGYFGLKTRAMVNK